MRLEALYAKWKMFIGHLRDRSSILNYLLNPNENGMGKAAKKVHCTVLFFAALFYQSLENQLSSTEGDAAPVFPVCEL